MAITLQPGTDLGSSPGGLPNPVAYQRRHGRAVVRAIFSDGSSPIRILPREDRYLLAFWGTTGTITIRPDGTDGSDLTGPVLNNNGSPIVLTFGTHGPLVNLGYSLSSIGAVTVTVIEAYYSEDEDGGPEGGGPDEILYAHITPRR